MRPVPCGLGDGRAAEDHVGGPLVGDAVRTWVGCAFSSAGKAVSGETPCPPTCQRQANDGAQLVSGWRCLRTRAWWCRKDERNCSFPTGGEDHGGLSVKHLAVYVGVRARASRAGSLASAASSSCAE